MSAHERCAYLKRSILMIAVRQPITPLMTVGQIARLLKQPQHRVQYVISSRNIQESARAGRLRIFDLDAVDQIRQELAAIDAAAGRRHRSVTRNLTSTITERTSDE